MNRFYPLVYLILLVLLVSLGCSNGSNPTTPAVSDESQIPLADAPDSYDSYMAGFFTMNLDLESLTATVIEDRDAATHYNVTSLIPAPTLQINSFNPGTGIVDVDITITNNTVLQVYDLRFIVYTDAVGHKLINDDNWTALFDIAGGLPINPFKAYKKDNPNRAFPGKTNSTENMLIYLPGGNTSVRFAIEASHPSNCEEPYQMTNFTQGTLYDTAGASTSLSVDVFDHQSNIAAVQIHCPQITGSPLVGFAFDSGNTWKANFVNTLGVPEGEYTGYLIATSSGVSLFDEVKIAVTHQQGGIEPVGDLRVVKINRGENGLNAYQITSVDFDWDDSNGAVEYAFERADGYTGTGWTVVNATTSSNFKFTPTGYDLDDDIRFRVIARAVPGGDPQSDAGPSEEVFILFMSNMGDVNSTPGPNNWKVVKKNASHGLDLRRWYWGVDDWGECGLGFYGDNQVGVINTNTWAIAHTPFEVPNLDGSHEAYFDGYYSPGANWDPVTLGFCIGTLSAPPTQDTTCFDFEPATDILGSGYFAYNNPNCQGINQQFGETNQGAWRLSADFGPPEIWRHIGYYLNDLLDPTRNYIALGFANGDTPLTPGTS